MFLQLLSQLTLFKKKSNKNKPSLNTPTPILTHTSITTLSTNTSQMYFVHASFYQANNTFMILVCVVPVLMMTYLCWHAECVAGLNQTSTAAATPGQN